MKKFLVMLIFVAIFWCSTCGFTEDARGELKIPEPLPVEEYVEIKKYKPEPVYYDIPLSKELQEFIWNICQEKQFSYELALAIMYTESEYKNVISETQDFGIMQINQSNHDWLPKMAGIENFDPMNIKQNITVGLTYLVYLRDFWRSQGYCEEDIYYLTLLSYRRGQTGALEYVQKYGLQSEYIDKITEYKIWLETQNKE